MTSPTINQQIEKWLCSRVSSFQASNRPFITLSYAQSWDGSITTRSGEPLSFSGEESTQLTHQLRSLHDGILVGIGTVLSDDPQLTVRQWSGSNPQPDKQCWILTGRPGVESHGDQVDILAVDSADADQQQVPLEAAMSLLKERGIKSLMVEGGATVITAFLKAQLADALVLTVAPRIIGGYKAVGDLQAEGCDDQLRIHPLHCAPAGRDFIVWGDFQYGETDR